MPYRPMARPHRLTASVHVQHAPDYNGPSPFTGAIVRSSKFLLPFLVLGCIALAPSEAAESFDRAEVRALHADIIAPASDALFEAEREIPGTDHQWQQLQGIAKELAKASDRLIAIGAGKTEAQWSTSAGKMREESENIARAAGAKNHEAIVAANGKLEAACESCHAQYRAAQK